MTDDHNQTAIAEFWDERASLEEQAGTRDLIAKELEVEAIAKYIKDGMRVLDAGCGNGLTALELARRYDIDMLAIDSSKEMIKAAAARAAGKPGEIRLDFRCVDVLDLSAYNGYFDLIYTERVLINLPDQESRNKAMVSICSRLRSGGLYVMCENRQGGLNALNMMRATIGLQKIVPPWHNHYLDAEDIHEFSSAVRDVAVLEDTDDYSATYYFLSRIVNAALAAQEGREPDYDSPINRLALKLPPNIGDVGQGRIWLWRRI